MAGGTRRAVTLTEAQRAELVRVRDRDQRAYLRERATAVLEVAGGQCARQVALVGLHRPRDPDTVYAWLDGYARGGVSGLVQRARRPRGFPPAGGGAGRDGAAGARGARGRARPLAAG